MFAGYNTATSERGIYTMDTNGGNVESVIVGPDGPEYDLAEPHYAAYSSWMSGLASDDTLLRRYSPTIVYDSQEGYYADSAATMAEHVGNELVSGSEVLVTAGDPDAPLNLGTLGSTYPIGLGRPALPDDRLDAIGDNSVAAQSMHLVPSYANKAYGRVVRQNHRIWLEYWLWYYYNDGDATGTAGDHEGDWEYVSVELDRNQVPQTAVYSQHEGAERCPWTSVETDPDVSGHVGMTVYPGLGTHASYFQSGRHVLLHGVESDNNDAGQGAVRQEMISISGTQEPPWIAWPGRWGSSLQSQVAGIVDNPVSTTSPHGPDSAEHSQWDDPAGFAADASTCSVVNGPQPPSGSVGQSTATLPATSPNVPPPSMDTQVTGSGVKIDYRVPSARRTRALAVSVVAAGRRQIPISRILSTPRRVGRLVLPLPKRGKPPYTVKLSAISKRGLRSSIVVKTILKAS